MTDLSSLSEQEREFAALLFQFFRTLLCQKGGEGLGLRNAQTSAEKFNFSLKYDNIEYENSSSRGSQVSGASLYNMGSRKEQEEITSRVAQEAVKRAFYVGKKLSRKGSDRRLITS